MEKYSLRADWGQLMYVMELNVTLESAGWYTCGYQHKDEKNWVRSSALSVPRQVAVTGSESSTQRAPTAPDPLLHRDLGIGLGLAAASVLLLAAVNCWFLKRVGCGERCRRQDTESETFSPSSRPGSGEFPATRLKQATTMKYSTSALPTLGVTGLSCRR
ncbi:uncharacterized protein LOC129784736 isoform X3 [Falco peregrinus]|uniref:uncharacterized protein LOC129784736 isoform X3 n=1 Tax=Falco peregrinus TaxID=8954 RepID=UPI00247A50A5|nr:uncharacterized protein LOC129784736 isoform X3 [Falco peregrinus]